MSAIRSYEDLEVFRIAFALSLDVHRTSLTFPRHEQFELAQQLRRSSKSICANIAEGYGKQGASTAEFGRYLSMAIGSADETRLWCSFCFELGYIRQGMWDDWRERCQRIARMLQGLRRNWK